VHIILVSSRSATTRTITLTPLKALGAAVMLAAAVLLLASLFSYVTVRHAAEIRLPFLQELLRAVSLEENQRRQEYVKENLKVMATKLGEMQAQLTRLDSLGDRLSTLAGIRSPEKKAASPGDGRGGPLLLASELSTRELQTALDSLARDVEARTDALSLVETQLFEERVRKNQLPSTLPVNVQWNASAFGWRLDPFTGQRAMHEGVDFPAEVGTPVVAAASGVVLSVERHPDYGNVIEIDHGNDMTTRYAHASAIFARVGDVVRRGQKIAEVGSTGRSTGPHLHFEVRFRGSAQNPNHFLEQARVNTFAQR